MKHLWNLAITHPTNTRCEYYFWTAGEAIAQLENLRSEMGEIERKNHDRYDEVTLRCMECVTGEEDAVNAARKIDVMDYRKLTVAFYRENRTQNVWYDAAGNRVEIDTRIPATL